MFVLVVEVVLSCLCLCWWWGLCWVVCAGGGGGGGLFVLVVVAGAALGHGCSDSETWAHMPALCEECEEFCCVYIWGAPIYMYICPLHPPHHVRRFCTSKSCIQILCAHPFCPRSTAPPHLSPSPPHPPEALEEAALGFMASRRTHT